MATNKNALIRYKVLDRCFRNPGRRYFIGDLIAECNKVLTEMNPDFGGISRRQILEDIVFMEAPEGWSIELERHRHERRVYYRYSDMNFSINNMPLNEMEVDQLKSAIDILTQFKGMPQFEWIHELVPKLQQGTAENGKGTIIEFDSNQYLKGVEKLGDIHNAILYKKVLKVVYQPFVTDKSFEFLLHPYYLKQYNNRWFLYGFNPEQGKFDWNTPLDRIVSIEEVKGKYQKNTEIDWKEYFEDMIGATKPEGAVVERITLHFLGKAGKYVESKPLHGSQKSRWIDDSTLEITLQLMVNFELESLILSHGDNVHVIGPELLKRRIKDRLSAAVANY